MILTWIHRIMYPAEGVLLTSDFYEFHSIGSAESQRNRRSGLSLEYGRIMRFISEFKEVAMRGNVIDLAVGVVIGGAFGKIVSSLVEKIIVPLTGFLTQGKSVADLSYTIPLPDALKENFKPATIGYGAFLQATLDFIIVAFAIFLMVKLLNTLKKKQENAPETPAPTPEDVLLLREIRDSLAKAAPRRAE